MGCTPTGQLSLIPEESFLRVPAASGTGTTFWGERRLLPTPDGGVQQDVGPYSESARMSFRKSGFLPVVKMRREGKASSLMSLAKPQPWYHMSRPLLRNTVAGVWHHRGKKLLLNYSWSRVGWCLQLGSDQAVLSFPCPVTWKQGQWGEEGCQGGPASVSSLTSQQFWRAPLKF